ncbi:hypothetical protein HII31_12519 [Pseudocercospora fuligena]|uniref:Uncharacterized protein n=1 Tax=Pseudocercospora fuligena TaxID=685502 RepID=A0A8H6R989_9PEZI|nr:hypothetical protein HII31_12519 [Pseudocercospora fuligena]
MIAKEPKTTDDSRSQRPLDAIEPPAKRARIGMTDSSAYSSAPASNGFCNLPRELRDMIYLEDAKNNPPLLVRSKKPYLITLSPLALVNWSTRAEVLETALACSNKIVVPVRDFDFGHVVAFLNKCSRKQLAQFSRSAASNSSERTIHIRLDYFPRPLQDQTPLLKSLHRWIARASRSEKNGAGIDFRYHCDIARQKPVTIMPSQTAAIVFFLMKYENVKVWHPRSIKEADKISQAINEASAQAYDIWLERKRRNDEQDARIKASVQAEVLQE